MRKFIYLSYRQRGGGVESGQQTGVAGAGYKKYMCVICGFVYDEAAGLPEENIPPGTRWEDIPPTWVCPDCGANKDDFEMIEV
jgi:rubredoxin